MRKSVECAVAVLAAVTAVWGGASESVPSFAESAEEAKIDEELEELESLNRDGPFPCGYTDMRRVSMDSVFEIPLFLDDGGRGAPCYPCAPREVLRRYVPFDLDEPMSVWESDTNRFFGTFLHPMLKRRPSALSAPTPADMDDLNRREIEIGNVFGAKLSRTALIAGDTVRMKVTLGRNGKWREVVDSFEKCRPTAMGDEECVSLDAERAAVRDALLGWSFPEYLSNSSLKFTYVDVANPGKSRALHLVISIQGVPEPEYCDNRWKRIQSLLFR